MLPPTTFDDGTPRVSPSQIMTLLTCPAKWHYEKVLGLPRTDNENFIIGDTTHGVIEDWCNAEVPHALIDGLAGRADQNAERYASVTGQSREEAFTSLVQAVAPLLEAFEAWLKETGKQIVGCEESIEVMYHVDGHEVGLLGYYDLLLADPKAPIGEYEVLDLKTASRAPNKRTESPDDGVERSEYEMDRKYAYQVLTYAGGLLDKGFRVTRASTLTLTKTKVAKACYAWEPVTQEALEYADRITRQGIRVVLNDLFTPNPFGAGFLCSAKMCDYWGECTGPLKENQA